MEFLRRSISRQPSEAGPAEEQPTVTHEQRRDGADVDLSGMTKAQLAVLARDLGIPGRSKMTRDQLEAAVAEAQRRGGAA